MPRPPRSKDGASRVRALRATDEEWQRWTDAAEAKGLDRSTWIRRVLAGAKDCNRMVDDLIAERDRLAAEVERLRAKLASKQADLNAALDVEDEGYPAIEARLMAQRDEARAEVERLRAKADRFAAQRDDLAGVIERRNRKLNWTRGRLEAAEEVVEAARALVAATRELDPFFGSHTRGPLAEALERYDAGRE